MTLLPTPAAWEATRSGPHARYGNGTPQLSQVVTTLLPTPTDRGSAGRGMPSAAVAGQRYASGRRMLDDAVALLPTPRASDGAKGGPNQRGSPGDLTLTSSVILLPTPTVTNAHGDGHNNRGEPLLPTVVAYADRWAQYAPAIARWEAVLGRPAPEPTVTGKRGSRRLSARFVEWLLGWPDGWVTDLVDNTAALRLCGNGVVRQQGAAAYRALLEARDG